MKGGENMKNHKTMAKLFISLIAVLGFIIPQNVSAEDILVLAEVPSGSATITIVIKELTTPGQAPDTGTTRYGVMDFGELTHTLSGGGDAGVWYSQKYFCVLIYTSSFGQKYEIRSTSPGLVTLTDTLPAGCFGLTPGYVGADRWDGDNPSTAQDTDDNPPGTLHPAGPAITGIGAYRPIYTSEAAASNRIIRAFYSLPSYGAGGALPFTGYTPILVGQSPGTYVGTVTLTIAPV